MPLSPEFEQWLEAISDVPDAPLGPEEAWLWTRDGWVRVPDDDPWSFENPDLDAALSALLDLLTSRWAEKALRDAEQAGG